MNAPHFARWVAGIALALLMISSVIAPSGHSAAAAPTVVDWVGNLEPPTAASSSGDPVTITIEVYEPGVTDVTEGEAYNFECWLHWGQTPAFGGAWTPQPDQPMTFAADAGANDRYTVTINPLSGLYEYTAYCIHYDDGETTWSSDPDGNGQLTVTPPASGQCLGATTGDDNIYWSGLLHDSFSTDYRNPLGAVSNAPDTFVRLGVRACRNDLTGARLRVWDDRTNTEALYDLAVTQTLLDPTLGEVSFWTVDLIAPADPTILYYTFRLIDGTKTVYYRDDDPKFYGGGYGAPTDDQGAAELNSYQLSIYDRTFTVPDWAQRGVAYQVFPDRFRNGNTANDPAVGRFYYNVPGGAIVRSGTTDPTGWNVEVCDPRLAGPCANKYGENFYGGDLQGLAQKMNENYFTNLGVTVAYLTPIFSSPSNHKYDTANYRIIDKDFGGANAWNTLRGAGANKGVRFIFDGVFNHTSSDSTYFDLYSRYTAADTLSPLAQNSPGLDDNIQACESPNSVRRSWYFIAADAAEPRSAFPDLCDPVDTDDRLGAWTVPYSAWYGYGSLPKLNSANAGVRNLIYTGGLSNPLAPSVAPYWVREGADGWRLDVGGDIDPGLTNDPANDFWEGFRTAIRAQDVQTRALPIMIGEEWGDASPWLLGNEWDSVMNYRFRSAALGWLFTGCTGDGCTDGTKFEDNDSNEGSASGAITQLSPSQLNARLRSIAEDYPPPAFKAMMNLGGSHDTNRLRFVLRKINNDDDAAALQRMREFYLLTFTYAGLPTLYYGDEVGLTGNGVFANGKWEDDPYNRAPFPWDDTPGFYTADTDLQAFVRVLTSARHGYRALQDGDVDHGLIVDDANRVYGYARRANEIYAVVLLNRDGVDHEVTVSLDRTRYPQYDGQLLRDVLSGQTVTLACADETTPCTFTFTAPANSGVILVDPNQADTPRSPLLRIARGASTPTNVELNWNTVSSDTGNEYEFPAAYEVWWSEEPHFYASGEGSTLLTEALLPPFGSTGARLNYIDPGAVGDPGLNHYYRIVATNSAGGRAYETTAVGEFDFALVPGDAPAEP